MITELKKECRYCLSDLYGEKMIDPCRCEGTMKYVHQLCLQEWIINGNRKIFTFMNEKKIKFYSSICEICKYKMTYSKSFKNNIFSSFVKLVKSILTNWKSAILFSVHSVVIFFFLKRLKLFYKEFTQIFTKKVYIIHPDTLIRIIHNFTVVISILIGIGDIFKHYKKMLHQKRKCVIKFLPKYEAPQVK